jgi:hypothetical protein
MKLDQGVIKCIFRGKIYVEHENVIEDRICCKMCQNFWLFDF